MVNSDRDILKAFCNPHMALKMTATPHFPSIHIGSIFLAVVTSLDFLSKSNLTKKVAPVKKALVFHTLSRQSAESAEWTRWRSKRQCCFEYSNVLYMYILYSWFVSSCLSQKLGGRRRNRQLMRPLLHTNWGPRAAAFNLQERQRRRPRAVLWWWRDSTHTYKKGARMFVSVRVCAHRKVRARGREQGCGVSAPELLDKQTQQRHSTFHPPGSLFWELLINLESAFLSTSKPDTSLVIENEFLITGREHPLSRQ